MKTHGPISPEYKELMNTLAGALDEIFNGKNVKSEDKKNGFALLVFPFTGKGTGTDERINYISNAQRPDMLTAMKEFIARSEGMNIPDSKEKQ